MEKKTNKPRVENCSTTVSLGVGRGRKGKEEKKIDSYSKIGKCISRCSKLVLIIYGWRHGKGFNFLFVSLDFKIPRMCVTLVNVIMIII